MLSTLLWTVFLLVGAIQHATAASSTADVNGSPFPDLSDATVEDIQVALESKQFTSVQLTQVDPNP